MTQRTEGSTAASGGCFAADPSLQVFDIAPLCLQTCASAGRQNISLSALVEPSVPCYGREKVNKLECLAPTKSISTSAVGGHRADCLSQRTEMVDEEKASLFAPFWRSAPRKHHFLQGFHSRRKLLAARISLRFLSNKLLPKQHISICTAFSERHSQWRAARFACGLRRLPEQMLHHPPPSLAARGGGRNEKVVRCV